MKVSDLNASSPTNCMDGECHPEILKLATVGEDSDDDSQYETADESESDMELKPKAGNENNSIDSTTGLMGSEEEKTVEMDKINLETQAEDTTEQVSSDLTSLTLQLKIKDEEIDRQKVRE